MSMEIPNGPPRSEARPSFLINRNFALLWIGQAISDLGDRIFLVTLTLWIATDIARNQLWAPVAVSGVLFFVALPTLLLGPIAGVFVDRLDRRRTMICMDIIRATLILFLIPLPWVSRELPPFWSLGIIYGIVLAASMCAQFFLPARFAILSEILPTAQRAYGSALEQSFANVVRIVGPTLAAPLLFLIGVQWAFLTNALSFVASFAAIRAVTVPAFSRESLLQPQRTGFLREWKEGMSFYKESRLMLILLTAILIANSGSGAFNALSIFFFQQNLHGPDSLFGTLVTILGVGAVIGSLLTTLLVKRLGAMRVFWLSMCLIGIFSLIYARQSTLLAALLVSGLMGLPQGTLNTALTPLLMRIIPQKLMGRVMSVFTTLQTLCNLVSISLAGLLGSLMAGFHANLLGITFGPYDTIYMVAGLFMILGGFYTMFNVRGLKEAMDAG